MNYEAIEALMGVTAPWIIHEIHINKTYNRAEICIGMAKSGWFGTRRAIQSFDGHHKVWRHLSMGTMRCNVRVDYPAGGVLPDAPWSGDSRSPFSHALGNQIISLLSEGLSLGTISRLLELDADQLWQFKHGIDTGKLGSAAKIMANARKPAETAIAEEQAVESISSLPPVSDTVWQDLLTGDKVLDMRNLGLRLLLTRLRQQYSMAQDDDVRKLKVQQLRQYFEKNAGAAVYEIEQLMGAVQ